jgi:hypothetical protein
MAWWVLTRPDKCSPGGQSTTYLVLPIANHRRLYRATAAHLPHCVRPTTPTLTLHQTHISLHLPTSHISIRFSKHIHTSHTYFTLPAPFPNSPYLIITKSCMTLNTNFDTSTSKATSVRLLPLRMIINSRAQIGKWACRDGLCHMGGERWGVERRLGGWKRRREWGEVE